MKKISSKDGTTIAYETLGQGPALILVGGALSDHKAPPAGIPLAKHLAAHFTVYCYDRRGRGGSSDTLPYAVDREVEDIAALIERAGGSAYLYGMSSGAALALFASRNNAAIKKLALYEPPFVGGGQGEKYIMRLKELIAANRLSAAVALFMKTVGMPSFLIPIMRLTPMWSKLKELAPTLLYDALIMGDGTLPEHLEEIKAPTAVITGAAKRMSDAADTLAQKLPNARHQVLNGQTHNVKPAVLAPALIEFFGATV